MVAYACHLMCMCVCVCVCVCVCEFQDEILLRGGECKTREKSNFSRNCEMVISIENPKFF